MFEHNEEVTVDGEYSKRVSKFAPFNSYC